MTSYEDYRLYDSGADCASITDGIDHISDGCTPGSTFLCELTCDFHPVLFPLCSVLLTCTCVGIHPGRVEPASPTALTTSRTEALQARRSCTSSLAISTLSFFRCAQSDLLVLASVFLHYAQSKTHGQGWASRSALRMIPMSSAAFLLACATYEVAWAK